MSTWDILQYYHSKTDLTLQLHVVLHISKIQLVVYNQCCILIGWAIDDWLSYWLRAHSGSRNNIVKYIQYVQLYKGSCLFGY